MCIEDYEEGGTDLVRLFSRVRRTTENGERVQADTQPVLTHRQPSYSSSWDLSFDWHTPTRLFACHYNFIEWWSLLSSVKISHQLQAIQAP